MLTVSLATTVYVYPRHKQIFLGVAFASSNPCFAFTNPDNFPFSNDYAIGRIWRCEKSGEGQRERERERERERDRENVSISISKAFPLLSVLECLVSLLMFLPFLLTNRNLPLIIYDLSNSFSWKELLR